MVEVSGRKGLLERLEEKDVSLDDMADSAFELYEGEDIDEDQKKREFKRMVKKYSRDENIRILGFAGLLAGRECDAIQDPANIVADELIGIQIAEYIAGKKAHFNFMRYDRCKPGILGHLDVFEDDVVGGLIAGCMTRLFEE